MKKRLGILAVMLIALFSTNIFLLSGCSSKKDSKAVKSSGSKQEINIGIQGDLKSYDPNKGMYSPICALVYNTLIELDSDFKKVPGLAKEWKMSEDGKKWTFKLRENVVFHDDSPWNSKVGKLNLENRMKNSKKAFLKNIQSIETPDDLTLVINLKEPSYTLGSEMTAPHVAMIAEKGFDEKGTVIKPIGTGPFKFVSWKKDTDFVFEKNKKYFDGAPTLDKVNFKVITDSNARALALQAGEIDMMNGREALTAVKKFKNDSNIKISKKVGQTSELVLFNIYKAPFNDIKLRQAVSHAINFKEIIPQALGDVAEVPKNFFSDAYKEFIDPNCKLPEYDVEKAKNILKEDGYKDSDGDGILEKNGEKLTATIKLDSKNEEDKLIATAMQDALKKIGMDFKINMVDEAALRNVLENKDYETMMIGQWYVAHDDPTTNYLDGYCHTKSVYSIYKDPQLDELIDKLNASLDTNERLKLHKEVQRKVLEQTPALMVMHRNNVVLMNKKVANFDLAVGTWQYYRGLTKTVIK